ncbi:1-(5-phosphoribosyl)-5-[(5-phosphoribosylamino)methylideneamino]imidazole-4-carboxamide isomerase [Schleiferia thermophila]|jgi:phosphoribosylformimino-5-aminoimidazole carboxamide ribotide isomerase|uniref:1-(5-phosphoribosyl)-5-[(5-phosphoribosylamino)methylideneamino] imidazole-4-carboxamide isomerase n=1 Tax=Schleiferia thermophila TaxID=884107 RepID=A0A369A6Q7_9FLAO|nr:1-(5-phosphoribosyl)-5-[(5-phosphoribosylamino)methylideneamino] imidazole-4-carboxamide isomerase [Schleiferia thermophila]KFD39525.1 1-(5-phosphoribosyl)-5-[(5-phosphoribosylamino)methylideneamino] imidazole-4-carboxamide isomerase [Schleiferia thermophila str. Yellowstone]RCX05040.1 1-(5-phosphoribosyl)-5-[(5-phosphoribosylamino)methylideneamino] imidazole-4-carboxamide isomerase [Schleiferia thermophila]GCD79442.1 1-(5-phosphoribosyl)-5-[(5-phosphoribosylamino) me thylideneamino] imidazol
MKVFAAIDLMDGKCVRLSQGIYGTAITYHADPVYVARQFEAAGINYLHVVDLDGARLGKITHLKVLEQLATHTGLEIDFGGGITGEKDVTAVLAAGATRVSVGTLAVKNQKLMLQLIEQFGPDRFMPGADIKEHRLAVRGWTEISEITLKDFIAQYRAKGIRRFFCTDISRDGMLAGTSTDIYNEVLSTFPDLELIASGGIHHVSELDRLKEAGLWGAIVGKALYEGTIQLHELKAWLLSNA